ncbi:hypothetical protein BGZ46_006640 [Entomortierella lignicola]|nr:hypothetical protein BGZ46_006640 [Entomortierella lignicola]
MEEVELWNDEDGLVDSIDVLDSHSPSAKRPRIDSPKAMVSLTSNSGSSFSKVDPTKHLVGHENDVVKIVPALNGLLIFRRHKESILWTSQHGFKPGSLVAKTVVVDTNQADVTCHAVINEGRRLQIFYGLKSGEILLVEQPAIDEKTIKVKRLKTRIQLENQRIASLNRLVQVLQQSTVSQNHQEIGAITQLSLDHPIKTSFTTFVQPVAAGYNGQRRYYVRLTVESKLNIDWSKGWSGLSPHVPWTQDIEIDLQRLCLPLNVTLGLQFDDMSKTSRDRLKEYFDVESLILDAIHFSEPVRDRAKQNPAYYSQAITALRDDRKTRDESEKSTRRLFFSLNKQENTENDCKECDSVAFKSLIFDIDTTEIKAAQCLPALLGDAIPQDRLNALVNSSIRASLCISTECLPRTGTTRFLENKPILTQCDSSLVWVMLHVKEKSGSIVQASIDIKGVDQARALIVYHGLKKRVHDLFGLQ